VGGWVGLGGEMRLREGGGGFFFFLSVINYGMYLLIFRLKLST